MPFGIQMLLKTRGNCQSRPCSQDCCSRRRQAVSRSLRVGGVPCRLQELTGEVSTLQDPQRPGSGQHHVTSLVAGPGASLEDYKAPLIARVHLRLGMWRWTITPAEVRSPRRSRPPPMGRCPSAVSTSTGVTEIHKPVTTAIPARTLHGVAEMGRLDLRKLYGTFLPGLCHQWLQ